MSDSSYTPSPESDTLARLQHEALKDPEYVRPSNPPYPSFAAGQQLKEWRKATPVFNTPRRMLTDTDMDKAFPSFPGPSKPKFNRWEAHQLRRQTMTRSKAKRTETDTTATASAMGFFELLPGELRNAIYRLAFVPPPEHQPVLVTASDLICGTGACVHKEAYVAAPAMASTCRQIRAELLPIFCAENDFRFDAVMVRNRCGGSWARSLDGYASMVRKIVLEVVVQTRSRLNRSIESRVGEIVMECPAGRSDGRFELVFGASILEEKAEGCKLRRLVGRVNEDDGEERVAKKLERILGSDELAELVFRCRK